jgi:3,4-dihydroxy 2-butanone 4-phosphate synthase/GTP cyclohydrolase II
MPRCPVKRSPDTHLNRLRARLAEAEAFRRERKRPFVTVSYAQSIDGSIASRQRKPLILSGQASLLLTHRLRAIHQTILVGIGTVLADNPRLDVRLVPGRDPLPVVLDTHFRTPPACRLLERAAGGPLIVGGTADGDGRPAGLSAQGATISRCGLGADGRLDLDSLMALLDGMAVDSVMVEGGARVITSFIRARLVDQFVITLAPLLVGGLPVIDPWGMPAAEGLRLHKTQCQMLGEDLVIWAEPRWERP